jgi:molybdopterin synthase catalytic subunit
MIQIVTVAIDPGEVIRSVRETAAGAIAVFIGTTRDHSHGRRVVRLEYEAYEPMALRVMGDLAEAMKKKWEIEDVSIVHRVGNVNVGEVSVVIAVSAAHRREAFEACRHAIDELKESVPIWKKEYFEDGEEWVKARPRSE